MVIEVLGRLLAEKDDELQKQQETIDKLNKKLKLFEDYVAFYENVAVKGANNNGNKN